MNEMGEHKVSIVICLNCLKRFVSVRPVNTRLVDLECPNCGLPGAIIETGEEFDPEIEGEDNHPIQ